MKKTDLIQKITQAGAVLIRHESNHDWYRNPITGMSQPVLRHREINEYLTKSIIRKLK